MAKVAPAEFVRQVRQEALKVTWSSKKETVMSTVMVMVMVGLASLFFLVVDWVILSVVQSILGF